MKPQSLLRFAREIVVNVALPFAIYRLTCGTLGDVHALIVSSAPPTLWSIAEFIRHRRADALSLLVLFGIALSLLAYIGGGSIKLLQLRERLVTIIVAFVFLGSAAIGRPLMYELVRAFLARSNSPDLERVQSLRDDSFFKRGMTIMTLVWGWPPGRCGIVDPSGVRLVDLRLSRRQSDCGLRHDRIAHSVESLVRPEDAQERRGANGGAANVAWTRRDNGRFDVLVPGEPARRRLEAGR
jgi:hypothetical protein